MSTYPYGRNHPTLCFWSRREGRQMSITEQLHNFFYEQRFFSTQPQCCLTFSWIELQMLLRCCLIHTIIVIMRHFLHLLHLCRCLGLDLFVPSLCDLFLISIFIFIMINRIILLLYIFQNMSYYFWMVTWMTSVNNFHIATVQSQSVA